MAAFKELLSISNSASSFLMQFSCCCFRKIHVSARILHIQALFVLCGCQTNIALSLFVTNKATMMSNAFKDILGAKIHWYRFIILLSTDLYLFACIFRFIFGFNLVQGQIVYSATYTAY